MSQPRYKKNMHKTKKFVDEMVQSGRISSTVRICNTGLLIYINYNNIRELIKSVYDKCIEHQQPECQIYWSVFAQKYTNKIKKIELSDTNAKRFVP